MKPARKNIRNNKINKNTGKRIKILLLIAMLPIMLLLGGWGAFRLLAGAQDVARLAEPLPAATVIYDMNGAEAARLAFNKIEEIDFSEIPEHMVHAIVAVEDKRFFEHDGLDIRAISRALFTNFSAGGTVQGGSTITQQLAKNVFLSHERTWSRKWDEALLAYKIEDSFSKQDIMEMYMNQIYYGEGAWGIKRAAATYFGKEVRQLSVAESALLAGLIKAPSALTPYKHPERAQERRDLVLGLMKEQGMIDELTYNAAVKEPVKLLSSKPNRVDAIDYPYYIDQIIREAITEYGMSENEVLEGGLRIYTELDARMQQAAEQVYGDAAMFPESAADQLLQSGAILVDPRNGGIRALIGGRGEQPFRGFNRAVQLKRQPGSTIKPIAVYAPALEQGHSPKDKIEDEPININGYEPKNADGRYHGTVTLYEALIQSYNIPAVKLLSEIGVSAGVDAAMRFGLPLTEGDHTLGLALGGLQEGVSPLHMAEAFGVFANDGIKMQAHAITRIEAADGTLLAELSDTAGVKVTEPEIARTMTAMLEGVVTDGTGQAAAFGGRPLAGKSGTTQMPGTAGYGAKDNWFVGYTPQLVGAVWLGYDQSDSNHYLTTSSKAAAMVFQALMSRALQDEPALSFPKASDGLPNNKDSKKEKDNDSDKKKDKNREKEERKAAREKEKEEKKARKEKERSEREQQKSKGRDRNPDHDDDND